MKMQMHFQWSKGAEPDRFQFVEQFEAANSGEMDKKVHEIMARHTLPEGAIWMLCTPASPQFVPQEERDGITDTDAAGKA